MEQYADIFDRSMNDKDFQRVVEETLRGQVYERLRGEGGVASSMAKG
jgi:hypothetical protein